MSNRISRLAFKDEAASDPIPQVSSGTVPSAQKYVIAATKPSGVADNRFLQTDDKLLERVKALLLLKVTDAGAHTTFTVSIEGSFDGLLWFGLQMAIPAVTGLTQNGNGLSVAAAIATAGIALSIPGGFKFYRIGVAGDAVADGSGYVGLTAYREM